MTGISFTSFVGTVRGLTRDGGTSGSVTTVVRTNCKGATLRDGANADYFPVRATITLRGGLSADHSGDQTRHSRLV